MSEKPPFERELVHERYRILELLGSGASAQTYLCEDQASSGRRVALKLLRVEHLESWKYFELFEREAKVLASLDHHGIPKLFDFFELSAKGQERTSLGLVQEYIEGSSLAKRIEKGPRFAEAELIQLCLGILEILDYLHSSSPPVFHRDIKPSNIIVRPMGSPVLIDFGSVCDGWRPADEQGSTIVGTHGFMPPEQYLGQVSAASDLYALGATLLNLVSGRAPREFSFESGRIELPEELPMAAGMRRLLTALLEPAPRDRPKSARDARDLRLDPTPATSTLKPSAEVHALVPLKDALPALIQSDDDTPILV
ncbi:MAG: serine/threonine-protein kinase, partial [Myxococcota bacterium]|nr:serine/threonine-protein kinase [Myxococcota bacterium]